MSCVASMPAPKCAAKGADSLALKIRWIAGANGASVEQNPPLARALHASVEVDETIPAESCRAIARLIGFDAQPRTKKSLAIRTGALISLFEARGRFARRIRTTPSVRPRRGNLGKNEAGVSARRGDLSAAGR